MMNNEVKINLKIMTDIIQKKIIILDEIYNITVNQNSVLAAKEVDFGVFDDMIKEKRTRINDVNNLDEKFQKIYDGIKKDIIKFKDKYEENLKELKDYIQENMNMKMKIQLQEEKNKKILEKIYQ